MTQPITPLRQRMLDDMKLRNMADCTRRTYVRAVAGFSAFHGRSPDELTLEDVRDYQLHLVARGLKASSICQIMSALRFFYAVTLGRPEDAARRCQLDGQRTKQRLLLSVDTVSQAARATPLTARQVWKARSRAARCSLAVRRWRRSWNRLWI
jgi:integrase/recombinase XerD